MDLSSLNNGDWVRLRNVDFGTAGASSFMARVSSSGGSGNIEIHLNSSDEEVLMVIRDDGRGMHRMPELYARQGFGLNNMRERAEDLGGQWQIESEPGAGTRVTVRIPRTAKRA